jgi:hypothetical protein
MNYDKVFYNFIKFSEYDLAVFFQPDYMEGKELNTTHHIEGEYFSILEVEDMLGYKLLDGFPVAFQVPLSRID